MMMMQFELSRELWMNGSSSCWERWWEGRGGDTKKFIHDYQKKVATTAVDTKCFFAAEAISFFFSGQRCRCCCWCSLVNACERDEHVKANNSRERRGLRLRLQRRPPPPPNGTGTFLPLSWDHHTTTSGSSGKKQWGQKRTNADLPPVGKASPVFPSLSLSFALSFPNQLRLLWLLLWGCWRHGHFSFTSYRFTTTTANHKLSRRKVKVLNF